MQVRWLMSVRVGQRVLFHKEVDYLPFFVLSPGTTRTVQFVNAERGVCSVRLDEPVEGCEQWDNEVFFNVENSAMPVHAWETLQVVAWPLPGGNYA